MRFGAYRWQLPGLGFSHLLEALRRWTTRNPPKWETRQGENIPIQAIEDEKLPSQTTWPEKKAVCLLRKLQPPVRQLRMQETVKPWAVVLQLHWYEPQGFILALFFNLQVMHQGIVERVHSKPQGKAFYIPHKAVIQETAESMKIRIVYDASVWANEKAPSLNDCLEMGPTLKNKLWSVLIRNQFQPMAIAGDLKQVFLQIRIREKDRDTMRFHWFKDVATKEVETLWF